jgi:hypothetical protein
LLFSLLFLSCPFFLHFNHIVVIVFLLQSYY